MSAGISRGGSPLPSSSLAISRRPGRVLCAIRRENGFFRWGRFEAAPLKKIPAPPGERQDRRSLRCAFSTILSIVSPRRRASTSTILTLPASPKNGQTRTKAAAGRNQRESHHGCTETLRRATKKADTTRSNSTVVHGSPAKETEISALLYSVSSVSPW